MDNFVTANKAVPPTKTTVGTSECKEMTPEEKAEFNRIKARIIDSRPTAKMWYSWKSTKRSRSCAILLLFTDTNGDPVWWWKGPFHTIFKFYIAESPTTNEYVN